MVHVALLIACAVAIYLSCEWFVNAVEWLGQRLNIGTMAVGTILAAFGTALPESVVTLVAVTTGPSAEIRNIGVGAAINRDRHLWSPANRSLNSIRLRLRFSTVSGASTP